MAPRRDRRGPFICAIIGSRRPTLFNLGLRWSMVPPVPTYEFRCQECGCQHELFMPMKAAPSIGELSPTACPICAKPRLQRVLSVPTFADAALRTSIAGYPYVCHKFDARDLPGVKRTTADGYGIVESARHEREIMARSNVGAMPLARD